MKSRGFTLIEVLVALAIIGIALTAVVRASGQSADTALAMKARIHATWLAQNELALARATREWPEPGSSAGTAMMSGASFDWARVIQPTPNPNFRKLEITVSRNHEVLARLSGLLRNPNL